MTEKKIKNLPISDRLKGVLDELERITKKDEQSTQTPAHGGGDGRNEKEFPRVLGTS